MKSWETRRREEVSELVIVSHIVCVLIFMVAALSLNITHPSKGACAFNSFLFVLLGSSILIYAVQKMVPESNLTERLKTGDLALFLVSFTFSVTVIIFTGREASPVKVILLAPVIIAATSYGRKAGMVAAGCAWLILLILEMSSGRLFLAIDIQSSFSQTNPDSVFQADLVQGGIMLLLAWLIGGFAEIERKVRRNLIDLAHTDELTGLGNHRSFQDAIRRGIKEADSKAGELSLILIDVSHFKFYNEILGHQAGDEALKKLSAIILETMGLSDHAFRYGGDEFTVLAPGGPEEALVKARMIRQQVESHKFYRADIQPGGHLTVSLGIASFPRHGKTAKELVHYANDALYRAKYSLEKVQVYFSVMEDVSKLIAATERDLFNSIKTLVSIVNAKDRYTFGHSERVTFYSLLLARDTGLSEDEINNLKFAFYLHDIGKIEIERDLLNKTGPLNAEERGIFNMHTVWGADIVKPLVTLKQISEVIRSHHENYDGTGYPDGLAGTDIPLGARILRIADSYDAMTTDRPYRKKLTVEAACRELQRCAGTMFDPALVNIFVGILERESLDDKFIEGNWL
ncbi:MAG: bifunctional diguanylate cyclase/phosphohydrolase [Eubacteriales bacterium]